MSESQVIPRDVAGLGMTVLNRGSEGESGTATRKVYLSIVGPFNKDSTNALFLTNAGYIRRSVRVMGFLCSNHLPDPGMSKTQCRLAVGSSRTVSQAAQRRDDIAS